MFLLVMLSVSFASAQNPYTNTETTPVTVPSGGVANIDQTASTGVSFEITAAAGATGSVTSAVYGGNPQATATVPEGITLTNFVAVTFNMDAASFTQAKIVFHYTDADVAGIPTQLAIYKYIPETNSFLLLPSNVDTSAKTLTATVNSPTDPLFAIGNAVAGSAAPTTSPTPTPTQNTSNTGVPIWQIAAIIVVIVVAVVAVVFFFMRR